ncbi:ogr/Delta-like zinc finger family protein [Xenorhabdus bovienii]|uniref:ogr/Delta-like zinc finger family protein n=1 Tax=Xenorhabdus bovienii TaxID=40576 RepID=UPI0023B2D721|nr:ogr/Delta-like zinc finger family protein [Xenorhabdus bovienii]MDE9537268.1 ogr/Delta-like zinc finger family protein [Xenorhabdus bovienii]MDE9590214.1 ogr/Delta-like zinc finger family protein [Xenorhabdus bovienii]
MFRCPVCKSNSHTRSSVWQSEETKERYNQCQNINCGTTFVTCESFIRVISKGNNINKVKLHPKKIKKAA